MSSKLETLNARFVDPLAPNPDDIVITDIAHALSHQCRFNGYTSRHYSVAEHSVYVARLVAKRLESVNPGTLFKPMYGDGNRMSRQQIIRQALLHDATEAYLLDLPLPLKRHIPQYGNYEKALWRIIAEKFQVPFEMHPLIKEADKRLCSTEKLALLSNHVTEWEWGTFMRDNPPYVGDWDILDRYPVAPGLARRRFLDFYDQVREG